DRLDIELGVLAEPQARRAGEHDLADARAAVLGAVRRVEVADLDALAAHPDLEVVARHRGVGQDEVVVGVGADHRRALVEDVLLARVWPGDDAQAKRTLDEHPAGVVGEKLRVDTRHSYPRLYPDGGSARQPRQLRERAVGDRDAELDLLDL